MVCMVTGSWRLKESTRIFLPLCLSQSIFTGTNHLPAIVCLFICSPVCVSVVVVVVRCYRR